MGSFLPGREALSEVMLDGVEETTERNGIWLIEDPTDDADDICGIDVV